MTYIHTESQEPLTREDQIDLAGLDTEAEQPLEIDQQYQIKEDAPEPTPVEEKPFVRSLFIYGMTGLGLLFLIGVWQLMTPNQAPIEIVESPPEKQQPVAIPQVDYRGKLALRDQKHQLEQKQQQPTPAEVTKTPEPVTPTPIKQPTQPKPQPTTKPKVVRTTPTPRPRTQTTPRPREVKVESNPKIDPQQRWAELSNFGRGVPIASSQLAKNQTPATKTTFVNNVATKTANVSDTPSAGSLGILNRQPVESTARNNYQIAYGTTVTAEVSIPLLWDESVDSSSQPNKRFALILTDDLLASNGKVALEKGSVVVAESHSVNPDNRLVNASAVAIVYTDKQGNIKQRALPSQKLTILGKQQQPLIAKGHGDRGGDYAKTDLLVSSLSGLGKIGEVFTQPNTTSSVVSGSFGSSVTTTVDNRNREVWSAVLDGFFNPLAERISVRSLRQEAKLEQLPNIAVLEVGTEVSIIANDTFVID